MGKSMTDAWWMSSLDALSPEQWERLCDGCGKCCLHKLQDEDSDELYFTAVACRYLNDQTVTCHCYSERAEKNPDCLIITPESIAEMAEWLPRTCAYRLRYQGEPLPQWHPLVSGYKGSVDKAGQSVKHRTVSETQVDEEEWEELILLDLI